MSARRAPLDPASGTMMRPPYCVNEWGWLIHCRVPSNVSLQCRTVTATGFPICASRSRTVVTSAANIACRRNCRSGCRATKSWRIEETLRLIRIAAELGVSKVRITGGEPLTRRGILDFVRQIPEIPRITSIGLSTNGPCSHAKSRPQNNGGSAARCRCAVGEYFTRYPRCRVYSQITGRDFHAQVLMDWRAIAAGFDQIKLNAVLMRGRNEDQLLPLIEFAAARNLLLRFIELMPVSTTKF
jgi:Molybdenum cofactor biosynthesis enzyme